MPSPCKQPTCDKPIRAREYCSTHYATFMRGTLNSEKTLGERISEGKKKAKKARTGARISAAKKGQTYIRRKLEPYKPSTFGETHWNWKGGITSADKKERLKFRQTMQQVILARDNYTCQICDQYGGSLQIDHIKGWADYPELRFELDNCRTVCMACHYFVTFKRKMPEGTIWGHNLSKRVTS